MKNASKIEFLLRENSVANLLLPFSIFCTYMYYRNKRTNALNTESETI